MADRSGEGTDYAGRTGEVWWRNAEVSLSGLVAYLA